MKDRKESFVVPAGCTKIPDHFDSKMLAKIHEADKCGGQDPLHILTMLFGGDDGTTVGCQDECEYYWQVVGLTGYAWDHSAITLEHAKKTMRQVRALFGLPDDVKVHFKQDESVKGHTDRVGGAVTSFNSMTKEQWTNIDVGSRNEAVVIHEAIHTVFNSLGFPRTVAHGPDYCRAYIEVMKRLKKIDEVPLLALAKKMDLRIADKLPERLAAHLSKDTA